VAGQDDVKSIPVWNPRSDQENRSAKAITASNAQSTNRTYTAYRRHLNEHEGIKVNNVVPYSPSWIQTCKTAGSTTAGMP
jgi:hypothetical protein